MGVVESMEQFIQVLSDACQSLIEFAKSLDGIETLDEQQKRIYAERFAIWHGEN